MLMSFRKYSVEPCAWLEGLEPLRDLRRPYWFGLRVSDMAIEKLDDKIRLGLKILCTLQLVRLARRELSSMC